MIDTMGALSRKYSVDSTETQVSVSRDEYLDIDIVVVSKFTVLQKFETKLSVRLTVPPKTKVCSCAWYCGDLSLTICC